MVAMDFLDLRRKFGTAGSGEKFILLDRTTARPFLARVELVSACTRSQPASLLCKFPDTGGLLSMCRSREIWTGETPSASRPYPSPERGGSRYRRCFTARTQLFRTQSMTWGATL